VITGRNAKPYLNLMKRIDFNILHILPFVQSTWCRETYWQLQEFDKRKKAA
jgi:hypothetical protein